MLHKQRRTADQISYHFVWHGPVEGHFVLQVPVIDKRTSCRKQRTVAHHVQVSIGVRLRCFAKRLNSHERRLLLNHSANSDNHAWLSSCDGELIWSDPAWRYMELVWRATKNRETVGYVARRSDDT